MCLSRQAQTAALPGLWGLPDAHIKETACICFGDPYCEYDVRVYRPRSIRAVLLGLAIGAAAGIWR